MAVKAIPWLLGLLREGLWFRQLPAALQDAVIRHAVVRSFRRGQVICRAGRRPEGLYGLLEGRVHVTRAVGSDGEDLVHVGEPGFWIGEYALLTRGPAIVDTVAATAVRMLLLPHAAFERLVETEPRWYRPFALLALERYALMVAQLTDIRSLAPEERLRARLANILALRRLERFRAGAVVLHLSQEELARMVGVSRQTLNALLGRLRDDGLVEIGFRSLRIPDPSRLPVDAQVLTPAPARAR